MKSPFRKVRGLGLHKHDKRHRLDIQRSFAQLDELSQASQDMEDMRDCYDSLLSAAASTTNNAYEFSESLQEMGGCLLEKTALTDDEDNGRVLIMLGKVQFDIQKHIDNYRSHINLTITVPSECLLNELRIVEDMKKECDEKGRLKASKAEHVSSRRLQSARDEFDENATLCILRMKSLKKAQSRTLLTQASRHYAAQMCFFRKALKSLESIEPHVALTTEQQHIDYQFSGLEDDGDDIDSVFLSDEDDSDDDNYDTVEDNIDSLMTVGKNEVSTSGNSMELDNEDVRFPQVAPVTSEKVNMKRKPVWNSTTYNTNLNKGSKSAPLSVDPTFDPSERYRQMRQSSVRKLNTYALPTPLEKKSVISVNETQLKPPTNIWHSMPLEKISGKPTPLPAVSNAQTIKRYALSGPLTGDSQSKSKSKMPLYASGPIVSMPCHQPLPAVSLPVISELHELPRPPPKMANKKSYKVGFSAPLVSFKREPDLVETSKDLESDAAYMLPVPSTS